MSKHVGPMVENLKHQLQESPAVQADETGWREDGRNGYIWSVSTPTIRYYEYHPSRGSDVVKILIGERYEGVLGSDFYAAYNIHQGLHQRCWVHFLRDAHEVKEKYPHDEALLLWATSVKTIAACMTVRCLDQSKEREPHHKTFILLRTVYRLH